jgi:cytochrome c5
MQMSRIATTALITSIVILATAPFSACSRESATPVEAAPAAVAPGVQAGATVVSEYCGGCHVPPRPQAHTPAEWPAVVARMREHRQRAGLTVISPEDLDRILNYLQQTEGNT